MTAEEIPLCCVPAAVSGEDSARSIPSASLQGGAGSPLSNPHPLRGDEGRKTEEWDR